MTAMPSFGQFFRQRRQALGLTIREFCRRNGFDPGNISRLERGLLSPPKNSESLGTYAQALKLSPEDSEWETFFDLAATETGSIPPQMTANPVVREKLPKMFRRLRDQGRRRRAWTNAIDLEAWADSLDARARLPQLMRRLIHATVESLRRTEFPAGEGVQRPGWDGLVEAASGNAYVPSGMSGWEVGVEKDSRKKANEDFDKCVKACRGLDTRQLSYIFVTARKWVHKGVWCAEKNKIGLWKEVRVYDSADLEGWLEIAPAVDAWFAHLVGRRPEGVTDIDEHWANLAALTHPRLTPEVFLASRENVSQVLVEWFKGPPGALAFASHSPVEVIDFVAAYVASLDEAQRDAMAARILLVEEREAWRALAAESDGLVLISRPPLAVEAEMVAEAVRQEHHVLLCSHDFPTERAVTHQLPIPYYFHLEKALVSSGFNAEKAYRLARESGGSLTVLKRLVTHFPSTRYPVWSEPQEAKNLLPILLAGGWDDASAADQAVIAQLAGSSYDAVLSVAHRWLTAEDPPILRILTHWNLVSRADAWFLLAKHLSRTHLDTFEGIAVKVLGENDPKYELPLQARWQAALDHKLPKYSQQLRTGVAETLALLGAKSSPDVIEDSVPPARRAKRVVRKLLSDNIRWQRWASLSTHLPLLAEACPEAFLDAVESDLRRPKPALLQLFKQEDTLFGSSPHTGLLWALETLAWEPSLLSRLSSILAQLAQHDPGGQLANRPQRSLREIFLPWLPHTAAPMEQRIRILQRLIEHHPNAGWQLILSLLPGGHDISTPTHRPAWRDWALDRSEAVTVAEHWQQVEACAALLLSHINDNVERWEQLIQAFANFPATAQQQLLEKLQVFATRPLTIDAKQRITDVLRRKVYRHRYFSHTHWALPPSMVDALEMLQRQFEPQDPVARYAWLFGRLPHLPQESREQSQEERQQDVLRAQRAALEHILATGGLPKILELAEAVESPYSMGFVLGKTKLLQEEKTILPALLTAEQEKIATFAKGYTSGRFDNALWKWVDELPLAEWSVEQVSTCAQLLPFERKTWELVAQQGQDVMIHYWQHVQAFPGKLTAEDIEYAIGMLLQNHHPWQAVDMLAGALHQGCQLHAALIVKALQAGLESQHDEHNSTEKAATVWYEIQELIRCLQSDPNVDMQQLAALEWGYLELLDGYDTSPKTLHTYLQQEPHFFAELLSAVFPRNESPESVESATEEQKRRAQHAYSLLGSWQKVPGTRENGLVDAEKLTEWVATARALCQATGRLEVCDSRIGQVLAHAPRESDGSWPCLPVRDLVEEVDSDELIQGFEVGIFNKRGMYSKILAEGGEQERALAKQYVAYAEACNIEWPRTAAILRRVAQRYKEEARRADEKVREL